MPMHKTESVEETKTAILLWNALVQTKRNQGSKADPICVIAINKDDIAVVVHQLEQTGELAIATDGGKLKTYVKELEDIVAHPSPVCSNCETQAREILNTNKALKLAVDVVRNYAPEYLDRILDLAKNKN